MEKTFFYDQAVELMQGAYDLHVHSYPDHDKRSVNDFELLQEADAYGMAGVLIKNHYEPTVSRAALVNLRHDGKAKAYGSITLNWSVGGVNPYAVESAARMGAKMIWLPTREAVSSVRIAGLKDYRPRPSLRITDESGALLAATVEVLEVARDYGIPVSTGHILTEESFAVCKRGVDMGVRMILSHPEYDHTLISIEDQKRFLDMGVLIEKDWVDIALGLTTVAAVAESIRILGCERIYLATDRGQFKGEHPAEGMIMFISGLLENGIPERDIRTMIQSNPREILGE